MSSVSIPSLCIAYAIDRCTVEQVTEVFNIILDEDNVDSVHVIEKTNTKTGRPFKVFFINFKQVTDNLTSAVARIEKEGFIKVEYHGTWYWKVTLAKKKDDKPEKKGPRIMAHDE